jgi:hypothetical protein
MWHEHSLPQASAAQLWLCVIRERGAGVTWRRRSVSRFVRRAFEQAGEMAVTLSWGRFPMILVGEVGSKPAGAQGDIINPWVLCVDQTTLHCQGQLNAIESESEFAQFLGHVMQSLNMSLLALGVPGSLTTTTPLFHPQSHPSPGRWIDNRTAIASTPAAAAAQGWPYATHNLQQQQHSVDGQSPPWNPRAGTTASNTCWKEQAPGAAAELPCPSAI